MLQLISGRRASFPHDTDISGAPLPKAPRVTRGTLCYVLASGAGRGGRGRGNFVGNQCLATPLGRRGHCFSVLQLLSSQPLIPTRMLSLVLLNPFYI